MQPQPQPQWQDARSLAHVDALVREYLLFRGFANAARAAARDAVADPGMGFQVREHSFFFFVFHPSIATDLGLFFFFFFFSSAHSLSTPTLLSTTTTTQADAITDHVFRDLIPSAAHEELLSLLSFLSQRVFGRAPPPLAAAGVAAETAALRAFVVSALKAGKPEAALALLGAKADELCGTDASSAAEWAPWFALPHLCPSTLKKNSSAAASSSSSSSSSSSFSSRLSAAADVFPKCFRALRDPTWAQEAEATFRNALAEAACALPPPALLRLGRAGNRSEKELAARAAALEAENARLRARVEALEGRMISGGGFGGGTAAGRGITATMAAGAATAATAAAAAKATSNGAGRGGGRATATTTTNTASAATASTQPSPPRVASAAASGPPAASPPMWSWSPASPGLTK